MQHRVDRGHEERRRDLVAVEHRQDARHAALGAEVRRRQRRRRRRAVAQQRRFGVGVEAQADGDACVVGPRLRRQLPADARQFDRLAQLRLGPLGARLVGSRRLVACGRASDDGDRAGENESETERGRVRHRDSAARDYRLRC